MRTVLFALAAVLTLTPTVVHGRDTRSVGGPGDLDFPTAGTKYQSRLGKFAAAFPGTPQEQNQSVETPGGTLVMHTIGYESQNNALAVIWFDLPSAAVGQVPAKTLLDGAISGMAKGGTLSHDQEITFGQRKLPGRHVVIQSANGMWVRAVVLLRDNRVYMVMTGGSQEFVAGPTAVAFLKSFELTA